MATDEYLDLVDANDVVIGKKLRSEVYAEGLSNFRVVNGFLVNAQGKLWIPHRGPHKRIFPNALDCSIGGHVESGETYAEAFRRETMEELGIDTDALGAREIAVFTPADGVSAFMRVYEIRTDEPPVYNTDDFVGYEWIAPAELLHRIEAGESAKGDLAPIVRKLYA